MSEINIPLTLYTSVTNITEYAWWNESDGDGDPFVGYAYQWTVDLAINPQNTGDWEKSYLNNELDVRPGDWLLMTNTTTLALRIVSISSAAGSAMTTEITVLMST
mgnify:CR=1 FL=1